MAEEDKKPEEKEEEKPQSEEKKEEKKAAESEAPPPAVEAAPEPPQEILLRVFMHCQGCARKVRRCLKGFEGVEDVSTDMKTHKVVVKGEKADAAKVLERVQKKTHRQVELLSPLPKPQPSPPPEDAQKAEEKVVAKPDEKKEEVTKEEPQVVTVVLQANMHCEACAQEIKRRILKMKGVEKVEADLKSSQVTVNGIFDPSVLVEYVHKRTGKRVSIVTTESKKNEKEEEKEKEEAKEQEQEKEREKEQEKTEDKEEKAKVGDVKGEAGSGDTKAVAEEKKDGGGPVADPVVPVADAGDEAGKAVEVKRSEFYYTDPVNFHVYPPYQQRFNNAYAYAYYPPAPQMFSDENPNACAVM